MIWQHVSMVTLALRLFDFQLLDIAPLVRLRESRCV